ncbi:hypothetical protein M9H77_30597 [Catharanthus roseus]|uniref:Uncharacterized protein n=1 Tax=Catharanthus roseus TaxID=4058 RepID=A0ACB9ZXP9_CATRO|nr:hypothetical protein M9H77_30597 [Catharanthus roseus]
MEKDLKSKLEGFEGQKSLPSCSQCVQLAKIIQGNKLEVKTAKSLKMSTLPPTVALPLPSLVGFCRPKIWKTMPYCRRLVSPYRLIMSTDCHLATQSHQDDTSEPTRMILNKTLRSMQQSIERLARQFQSIARDVEELKKGTSIRSGRRGGLGGRGHYTIMEIILMLVKHSMVATVVINKGIKL